MEFNTLEKIGLAFVSGLKIAEIAEEAVAKDNEEKAEQKEEEPQVCAEENKPENKIEKIEICEITPKEMEKVLDDLKNKIVGGK